jgi:hypothetical protein
MVLGDFTGRRAPAEETLGIFLAMDGNNKAKIAKLLGKSKEFAKCLCTSILIQPNA